MHTKKKRIEGGEETEKIFIIIGAAVIFLITSIVMCWIRTWKKIKRIREEIERGLYDI